MTTKIHATSTTTRELDEAMLGHVCGGTTFETSDDSTYLKNAGYMDDDFTTMGCTFHWDSYSAKVDDAWHRAGVWCETDPWGYNEYAINGERVNRIKALEYLKAHPAA